jgi:UDP-N-acetylglucosamine acyltransferase
MPIDQRAIVDPSAKIGADTEIAAGAVIEEGVQIGRNCRIGAYAILRSGTVLGDDVRVDSFAVLGGEPQSLSFESSVRSGLVVGSGTVIREAVTISRASEADASTQIGDGCFIMANAHVAHDCALGNEVVLANNVMIAGHVKVGPKVFVGGGAGIHQFCRIGTHSMIAGNASITADVPPYVMAAERSVAHGLNLVGLKRDQFDRREIADLKRCYRAVFFGGGNLRRKAEEAAREHEFGTTAPGARFLSFFESGKRGFIQSARD